MVDHRSNPPVGSYTAEEYTRRADHTPQTAHTESETYILTLTTDPAHHKAVTALRQKHFPPRLNKLSAHIALFRALPGSELAIIKPAIEDLVHQSHPFPISTGKPFRLSHGVGLEAHVEPAKQIYDTLKRQWAGFLSKQDQSFKPHYTIQNKAEEGVPEKTIEEVRQSFPGSGGMVTGLSLYLYDRGFWRMEKTYPFVGGGDQTQGVAPTVNDGKANDADWPALPAAKDGS
ncbi:MAG: hypothetical protein Q9220_000129 [cf. Caloplaca sp. 1 TL-2023]